MYWLLWSQSEARHRTQQGVMTMCPLVSIWIKGYTMLVLMDLALACIHPVSVVWVVFRVLSYHHQRFLADAVRICPHWHFVEPQDIYKKINLDFIPHLLSESPLSDPDVYRGHRGITHTHHSSDSLLIWQKSFVLELDSSFPTLETVGKVNFQSNMGKNWTSQMYSKPPKL